MDGEEAIIRIQDLHYTYDAAGAQPVQALRGVDLTVQQGEYLVIVGHNGSGKSTLAKHLNALLIPTSGDVWVRAWNTRDRDQIRNIRSTVGMVFQTPDNQIVATIVEEDVAFGPENLGIPHAEMVRRVDWSLEQVDMLPLRRRAPHLLSGGQKQRVCIAGVLAMQPDVLVLDESTAMLDPLGREEVLETARRLNREQGVTIVAITHFMREAIHAHRMIVMAEGRIAMEGAPRQIFARIDELHALQMDVPPMAQLAMALHTTGPKGGPDFPTDILTVDEMVDALVQRSIRPIPVDGSSESSAATASGKAPRAFPTFPEDSAPSLNIGASPTFENSMTCDHAEQETDRDAASPVIQVRHLVHDYMRGTPLQVRAIHDASLDINKGEIVGIIGHTGSGKSTLVQHFNALLRPHGGEVTIFAHQIHASNADISAVRRRVGLVFQFPEAQLFERYVGDDVAYGPRNLQLSREEVRARVRKAMELVGLGFEEFKDRPTFGLSGGQLRRVALAGVLALEPEVLVLDEPTAGLDPAGRRQLLQHILDLHRQGTTLVLISHNMEELAEVCDRLYVIDDGRTVLDGTPAAIFTRGDVLRAQGLDVPASQQVADRLVERGLLPPGVVAYTVEALLPLLRSLLERAGT